MEYAVCEGSEFSDMRHFSKTLPHEDMFAVGQLENWSTRLLLCHLFCTRKAGYMLYFYTRATRRKAWPRGANRGLAHSKQAKEQDYGVAKVQKSPAGKFRNSCWLNPAFVSWLSLSMAGSHYLLLL